MSSVDEIAAQALQLSPRDRMHLADILESSLPTGDVAAAWATELERRVDAYDRGEVQASDSSDLVERVREKLAERHRP